MAAFAALTGIRHTPWEWEVIEGLDGVYWLAKAKKWPPKEEDE